MGAVGGHSGTSTWHGFSGVQLCLIFQRADLYLGLVFMLDGEDMCAFAGLRVKMRNLGTSAN